MTNRASLYEQVVEVSTDFLGPAGERFMRRQISTHLDIEPEQLQHKHVEELVNWVRPTFALLTDNTAHVDAFAGRLLELSKQMPDKAKARYGRTH